MQSSDFGIGANQTWVSYRSILTSCLKLKSPCEMSRSTFMPVGVDAEFPLAPWTASPGFSTDSFASGSGAGILSKTESTACGHSYREFWCYICWIDAEVDSKLALYAKVYVPTKMWSRFSNWNFFILGHKSTCLSHIVRVRWLQIQLQLDGVEGDELVALTVVQGVQ